MMYYQNRQQVEQRLMTVFGTGSLSIKPDTVNIRLEIITRDEKLQVAQEENAERTNRVIQALIQLGVPQENIQTAMFNIQPIYDFQDGEQIFKGYEVTHGLDVQYENIDGAGQVIDVAVDQGANRVADIQFTVENNEEYVDEVLRLAVLDAERKAKLIATTLKVTVDLIPLKVTEISAHTPTTPQTFAKMESTPIEPGQIIVQAQVKAEFQY